MGICSGDVRMGSSRALIFPVTLGGSLGCYKKLMVIVKLIFNKLSGGLGLGC